MSKYIYMAICRNYEGKFAAQAVRISPYVNLANLFKADNSIVACNILPTAKEAVATARYWEDSFIANGTSFFERNYITSCNQLYL